MTATIAAPQVETIRSNEYSELLAVPVTLRQVEAAGVELDGGRWGLDAAEHQEMLDEAGLLRLMFGVELVDGDVQRTFDIEVYESRSLRPAEWHSCTATYNAFNGQSNAANYRRNEMRVEALLGQVLPNWTALIADAEGVFEAWVEEMEAEAERIRAADAAFDAQYDVDWSRTNA